MSAGYRKWRKRHGRKRFGRFHDRIVKWFVVEQRDWVKQFVVE
jgi:hypothetical protein